jgi:hypothetical protein
MGVMHWKAAMTCNACMTLASGTHMGVSAVFSLHAPHMMTFTPWLHARTDCVPSCALLTSLSPLRCCLGLCISTHLPHRAKFRVNAANRTEAFCTLEGLPSDLLVRGDVNQNR